MDKAKEVKVPSKERKGETGFGQFVNDLTESFTLDNAIKIATILGFTAANIDKIKRDTPDGHVFPRFLQEKGVISKRDISPLLEALAKVGLHGIATDLQESFSRNVSSNGLSPVDDPGVQRKKRSFIEDLKAAYKKMYNALQPVPYYKYKYTSVDNVFVDSGLELLHTKTGTYNRNIWIPMDSYNSVFTDSRVDTNRIVLWGDPGYGKSTFALQYAYDWCNAIDTSPLKNSEILIFLRLRQLQNATSIYTVVKHILLSRESELREYDIKQILCNSESVVIIFDGLDEYLQQGGDTTDDVMAIIQQEMFRSFKVIVTTRNSTKLLKLLTLGTQQFRLTGFDNKARKKYVLKAIVNGRSRDADKILNKLQGDPVLSDICQVPLFFVMFAHVTFEDERAPVFETVTNFFRYVLTCFYKHMQIRTGVDDETLRVMQRREHFELDKAAFESLKLDTNGSVWHKEELVERIGNELYNDLIQIGILVEEENLTIVDKPGTSLADHMVCKTYVSFFHQIFREWFAAHYVAEYVKNHPDCNLQDIFSDTDPPVLNYLFRFTCGMSPTATKKITAYLKSKEGGDNAVAILCILEERGQFDRIKGIIEKMCSEGVVISGYDSLLLQRSSIKLLQLASRNAISANFVLLHHCFRSVDLSIPAIITTSGLAFTSRIEAEKIQFIMHNLKVGKDEAIDLLTFALKCPALKSVGFTGCMFPETFEVDSTLLTLHSRPIAVWWRCVETESRHELLPSGKWLNMFTLQELTTEDYERMTSSCAQYGHMETEEFRRQAPKTARQSLRKLAIARKGDK